MDTKIYNAQEAAEYMRVSRVTLYRMVEKGQIRCFRIGSIYRFSEEMIREFINTGGTRSLSDEGGGE